MTATVTPLKPRTLAHVLLDLRIVEALLKTAAESCERLYTQGTREEYLAACDAFAAHDARVLDLRDEARAMVEQLTGCSWDSIEAAL